MRLVDLFIPAILFTRDTVETITESQMDVENLALKYDQFYQKGKMDAEDLGFESEIFDQAWYAVAAYVDEKLLTSKWSERRAWFKHSLQRKYFQTTQAGAEFYDRLNSLNRHGDDKSVREVFLLCLGLGFKGKYFPPSDRPKLESVREFNMGLLLPDEAQTNLENTVLFRSAFSKEQLEGRESKKRMNLIPMLLFLPMAILGGSFMYYAFQIRDALNSLVNLVN